MAWIDKQEGDWIGSQEAAALLGVSYGAFRAAASRGQLGELDRLKDGTRVYYRREQIEGSGWTPKVRNAAPEGEIGPGWIPTKDAAEVLGMSEPHFSNAISIGRIKLQRRKSNGRTYFLRSEVESTVRPGKRYVRPAPPGFVTLAEWAKIKGIGYCAARTKVVDEDYEIERGRIYVRWGGERLVRPPATPTSIAALELRIRKLRRQHPDDPAWIRIANELQEEVT